MFVYRVYKVFLAATVMFIIYHGILYMVLSNIINKQFGDFTPNELALVERQNKIEWFVTHLPTARLALESMVSRSQNSIRRYFAASSLGNNNITASTPILCRVSFLDPALHVRIAAVYALATFATKKSIACLESHFSSDTQQVRDAAMRELSIINSGH